MSEIRRKLLINQEESVDPDLIFFAPLNKGNLTDSISGTTLIVQNNRVYYDDDKHMYYVVKNTPDNYWPTHLLDYMSTSDKYTMVLDCIYPTNSSLNLPMMLVIGGWDSGQTIKPIIARRLEERQGAVKVRKCFVYDGIKTIVFLNGNKIFEESAPTLANPRNWNATNLCSTRVTLGGKRMSQDNINFWCNNARIYKRVLTPTEMMNIPYIDN